MAKLKTPNTHAFRGLIAQLDPVLDSGEWAVTVGPKTRTHDGYAWSARLFRNGALVGRVVDHGRGGELVFDWSANGGSLMDTLRAHAASQHWILDGTKHAHDPSSFVSALADHAEMMRKLKAKCRSTLMYVQGEKVLGMPLPADDAERARYLASFKDNYPARVTLNEMLAEVF